MLTNFQKTSILVVLSCFSFLSTTKVFANEDICQKAHDAYQTIYKFHVEKIVLDDDQSVKIFDSFLTFLDPSKMFFSEEDYETLKKYKFAIDDQIINKKCDFLELTFNLYSKRLIEFSDYLFEATSLTLPSNTETIQICTEVFTPQSQQKEIWRNQLLYSRLNEEISNEQDTTLKNKLSFEDLIALEQCKLSNKVKDQNAIKEIVNQSYLEALAYSFDPHTTYFNQESLNELTNGLSSEIQSFGFTVAENEKGEFQIINLIPGSSAWRSGTVQESDIIKAIGFPDGNIIRLNCLYLSDVMSKLNSENLKNATFYIKKTGGDELSITLDKNAEQVTENIIDSYILEGDRKLAYLRLPSFYSNSHEAWNIPNGSADDLAKEIIQLQRQDIEGLILDLRDNTGGDMYEAMRICGMFVDKGALAIVANKGDQLETLKDIDRGVVYGGPLVVMVNNASASASELFASAMQDHNRAIVVGSQTFGKGTIQNVLPLKAHDKKYLENYSAEPEDFIKVTSGKFFRLDGSSIQRKGVTPDILIPSILDFMDVGEAHSDYALTAGPVTKKTYFWPSKTVLPVQKLGELSKSRIGKNSNFKMLKQLGQLIDKEFKKCEVVLDKTILEETYKKFNELRPVYTYDEFKVKLPEYKLEDLYKESIKTNYKSIQEDLMLIEANHILTDLLNQ